MQNNQTWLSTTLRWRLIPAVAVAPSADRRWPFTGLSWQEDNLALTRVVQELARGQSRGVDCAQAGHFADRCWFLLLFVGTGIHDAAGGEYVISRPSRAPCRTPRSSTLPTGWWRSLKSVIVSVQTSVKIQSTLIIFFSYFCMVLNLPL